MELNKDLYRREYLCKWYFNKAYEEAYKQQIIYEYKCESYDRSICVGEFDQYGCVKMSGEEWKMSNINARQCYKEMMNEIQQYNANTEEKITTDIIQKVKLEVSRLTWNGVQTEYKRLFENVEI